MAKLIVKTCGVVAVAVTASAAALDVAVGAFYAPARVVGAVTEMEFEEYEGKEFSKGGFKGRVSVAVYDGLNVAIGLGYNNLIYREEPITFPEISYVTSMPTYITTLGADYALRLGPFRPFAGGGLAIAGETAEAYGHATTDWYGGLYAEAGARYPIAGGLAAEVAPRYTLLFDEPAVLYDAFNVNDFVRAEHHSQLVELMVGVNYYF